MKVELLVPRASARGAHQIGDRIEVSREEAARMIEKGQARPVRRRAAERAVPPDQAEKAVR